MLSKTKLYITSKAKLYFAWCIYSHSIAFYTQTEISTMTLS